MSSILLPSVSYYLCRVWSTRFMCLVFFSLATPAIGPHQPVCSLPTQSVRKVQCVVGQDAPTIQLQSMRAPYEPRHLMRCIPAHCHSPTAGRDPRPLDFHRAKNTCYGKRLFPKGSSVASQRPSRLGEWPSTSRFTWNYLQIHVNSDFLIYKMGLFPARKAMVKVKEYLVIYAKHPAEGPGHTSYKWQL